MITKLIITICMAPVINKEREYPSPRELVKVLSVVTVHETESSDDKNYDTE